MTSQVNASQDVVIVDGGTSANQATVTAAGALRVDASAAGGGTVTANQGTPATTANAWPVNLFVNGVQVNVQTGPTGVANAISVATGMTASQTTLSAATGTGAGTTIDLGSSFNYFTMALSGTSTSTQVDLEGSVDNTNFVKLTVDTAATVAAPRGVFSGQKPVRYVRGNVISIANGNVTAKIMASN